MNDADEYTAENSGNSLNRLHLPLLALLAVLFFLIGIAGFAQYNHEAGQREPLWNLAYRSLQLFALESGSVQGNVPWILQLARFLAPATTFLAVAQALAGIFRSELRAFRLSRSKDHIVVCGMGAKASSITQTFRSERKRVVIIDQGAEKSMLAACENAGSFVVRGDATKSRSLKTARAYHAEHVFVMTSNDSTNIEILVNLIRLFDTSKSRTKRLTCHVHLVDRQTAEVFKRHRIFKDASDQVDVHIFNVYDNAARLLWREHLISQAPIACSDARRMHVLIGGLGQMGEAILLRLVRSAHMANAKKVALTVIDSNAAQRQAHLFEQYPLLPQLCDIRFVEADLEQPGTIHQIAERLSGPDEIASVVLCLDQDYVNFATALRMRTHLELKTAQIFVRLSQAAGLCELLKMDHGATSHTRLVFSFGQTDTCCSKEMILTDSINRFARSFHEAYVRDRLKMGVPETDPALQPWASLLDDFRESNCEQAEHVEVKLRTFGYSSTLTGGRVPKEFDDAQAETLAQMEHARWCAERGLAGWTYAQGPKDIVRRTSPYLLPWNQLDAAARKTDFDFIHAIPRVLTSES